MEKRQARKTRSLTNRRGTPCGDQYRRQSRQYFRRFSASERGVLDRILTYFVPRFRSRNAFRKSTTKINFAVVIFRLFYVEFVGRSENRKLVYAAATVNNGKK